MKMAGLSVDVDSVASHLEGYGFDRPQDDGTAMRLAVPRAMDLFERYEARATFFLIGCEAESYPDAVREIADRGHEVASHSMTHRLPFATLDNERAQEEIIDSKELLLRLSGEEVVGFRAPSWDADTTLCERLARAGYSYDASAYPSILLPLLRRDRVARFFCLGMVIALVPSCAAFPDDRLLFFASFGSMGVMAQFMAASMAPR